MSRSSRHDEKAPRVFWLGRKTARIISSALRARLRNYNIPTVRGEESFGVVCAESPAHALFFHCLECLLHPRVGEHRSAHEIRHEQAARCGKTRNIFQNLVHGGLVEIVEKPL